MTGTGATGAGVMGQRGVSGQGSTGQGSRGRGRTGLAGRKSGFGPATMNGPIVGVVSTSGKRAFGMYYGKRYFDEWEFHVFINQVVDPRRARAIPGLNVNPTG